MSVRTITSTARLALCSAATMLAVGTASAQVKISQVYGSGGNVGSAQFSDYIEIYNAGAPQSLSGWAVQYASSTGTFSGTNVIALPAVTLGTGQYLLIQQGTGGTLAAGQAVALPTPQATGTIAMSGTDFKVALTNTTTALGTASPTYTGNPSLVDLIGCGTATWNDNAAAGAVFSSANNAPPASTAHALYRRLCGGADTNSSRSDWAVGWPSPRNTSTALTTGANGLNTIGAALPHILEELQTVRLTATPFRCDTVDLGAGTTCTVDCTLIGGGAAVAMTDDGLGADQAAGDGVYTATAVVAAGTTTGSKHLPVTLTDTAGNTGGTYIGLVVSPTTTPDNDNCGSATSVGATFPVTIASTFTGLNNESNWVSSVPGPFPPQTVTIGSGNSSRRGAWYSVVGTGNTMTVDTCQSTTDTQVIVWGGTCDGMIHVVNSDDAGTGGPCGTATTSSFASWCSVLGETYYIYVCPFSTGAQTTAYSLRVSDSGTSCGTALPVSTCAYTPPGGAYQEVEPGFGIHNNDGCDSTPNIFNDIPGVVSFPGTPICGRARGMGGNKDVDWYRFQAAVSDTLTVSLTPQSPIQIAIMSLSAGGVCPATAIAVSAPTNRCTPTIASVGVTAGNWYAVRVLHSPAPTTHFGGLMPGGLTYNYCGTVTLGGPPINDNCASASTLALGGTGSGNTSLATNDGSSSCDATGRDVWYSITTTVAGKLHIDTCGSAIDTVVSLYSSCGGAEIACNDDAGGCVCSGPSSSLDLPAIAPGTYRLRVSDKGIGSGGSFVVRALFDATAGANDACCDATPIAVPSVTNGTTVAATAENPLPPACAGALPGGAQSFTYTSGVWYSLSVGTTQTVTLDTLVSAYDSKVWVFDASAGCSSLVCVTANDDIQGSPFQSKVAFVAQAGVPYRVLVAPFSTTTGAFTLTASGDPTPANDLCTAPQVLSGANGSVSGTTVGSTPFHNTATTANPSCQPSTSYSMFAVWYQYTAPCDGNVTFNTCGSYDTIVSVHSACPTTTANNQVTGACNLDGPSGCTPGSTVTVAMTNGQTVLVRVAGQIGAAANGTFTLTYGLPDGDVDGTPDCLDGCPADPLKTAPGVCGCGISDVDTDGDLTPDCNDGCPTDPLKTAPGICGCNVSDVDTDGDLTPDCNDGCPTDPLKIAPGACGCNVSDVDTDGDLTPDCNDGCPTDPLKTAPGACGCNVADTDTDGDLTPDCIDGCPTDPLKIAPGQCGCGAPDTDTDGDLTADCIDGCPLDPLKIAPGQCGCGIADTDTDTDGIADCNDNCDTIANPGQEDCDLDGDGDVCEIFNQTASDLNSNGIPDNCEVGVIPYCTPGTSVQGCTPTLTTIGTPSASAANGFYIVSTGNDGQRVGQFFYGITGPQATPFASGFMCVNAPRQRMGQPMPTGGAAGFCNGALFIDANVFGQTNPGAMGMPLTTGLTYYYEGYNRDPGSPGTLVMTSAVAVTYGP